jgi:hypothetical protein
VIDWVVIQLPGSCSNISLVADGGKVYVVGYPLGAGVADSADFVGKWGAYSSSARQIYIGVIKGTYANLAAAQAALAGTVVWYQLATPVVTPIATPDDLTVYPDGTLYVDAYDEGALDKALSLVPVTVMAYPTSIAHLIQKIWQLQTAVVGLGGTL